MNRKISAAAAIVTAAALMFGACGSTADVPAESAADTVVTDGQSGTVAETSAETAAVTAAMTTEAAAETAAVTEAEPEKEALPPSVSFSAESGFYPEEFELVLSAEEAGEIYYTTDGSNPADSETAVPYIAPLMITSRDGDKNVVSAVDPVLISGNFNKVNESRDGFECEMPVPDDGAVDKCTVIRAAVKKSDGSFLGESFSAYYIGTAEEHIQGLAESCEAAGTSLAVINIAMDYDDLFGSEQGIYVKGSTFDRSLEEYLKTERLRDAETARSLDANYKQRGREWERTAAISMMEVTPDGSEEVISMNCGIRVQGNYSRSDLQKGFRLYARKEYGDNNFRHAVFGEDYLNDSGEVMDKFKNLVLRAGGNCAFTAKFNDAYWQSMLEETACETKESRPCVVYLNGEYWGLYVLEEDYTDDYFEDLHGVVKEDVVVYKGDAETYKRGYTLDEGEIPEGEREDYYFEELNRFFKTHKDLKSDSDYEEFTKLVDPQSVMDYFAVQSWINNKWDWPGKNWSMWKTINTDPSNEYADGRWRLMFYDMEFGGVSGGSDAKTNTIKEDNYKPKGLLDTDTNNPAVLSFAYLMTNEGFRTEFYARLSGLSEGYFEKSAALERLEEFERIYSPLYAQFFERYPETGSAEEALTADYASSGCIRDFLSERENYIQQMIDYCEKILA